MKGGRVIGRTDANGTEPTDRPVTPQELVATIFHALGVPADATIPGPDGTPVAVYPAAPVRSCSDRVNHRDTETQRRQEKTMFKTALSVLSSLCSLCLCG